MSPSQPRIGVRCKTPAYFRLPSPLFTQKECVIEEQKKEKRWIGIDCGKRTFEVKVIDGADKVTGFNGRTDPTGTDRLIVRLRKSDTVGIEAGYPAFVIARQILEQTGCEVVVLNKETYAFMDKQTVSIKLKRYGISSPQREVNGKSPVLVAGGINLV